MVWLTSLGVDCYRCFVVSCSIFFFDSRKMGAVFGAMVSLATMVHAVQRSSYISASATTVASSHWSMSLVILIESLVCLLRGSPIILLPIL
jgi:hypothetical protein